MDLHDAAKHYEDNRRFWAREIALMVDKATHQSRKQVLCFLSGRTEPMSADRIFKVLIGSSEAGGIHAGHLSTVLRQLYEGGLLSRERHFRAFYYRTTELGDMVVRHLQS